MLLAKGIEQSEELKGISGGLLGSDDLDGKALVEVDGDVERGVGGLERADSTSPTCGDEQVEFPSLGYITTYHMSSGGVTLGSSSIPAYTRQ